MGSKERNINKKRKRNRNIIKTMEKKEGQHREQITIITNKQ
jgi:hypothetical protein